ncbi:MAG: aminomuconate-semialdehyde/2-hydroxymuconate-6-semialdehyde dehydrogenase [Verrucomicrobiota bacterium]|jgi:aminomuconate-semialdehyde/2-hydroxymuconate-6-semialdehyde dehydrogenase
MPTELVKIRNFIDGKFVEPIGGKYLENIEPATGRPYSLVPDSEAQDVELAVAAAEKAFPAWSKTPVADRSRVLLRIADLIERDLEKLARAESIDTGKPVSLARSLDIPRAASNFRFFATAILHTENEAHVTDGVAFNYTLRQPRGIAGLISPWNLPLYLLSWKIAPAIAVGNTAIAKPSELTPMTAFLLCEICAEAGLPDGVLNIVHGTGPSVGAAITAHPGIGTISFTGGTVTGRKVAEAAAPLFKKVSLELGGKNPNIIFADADLDAAVAGSVRSSFANQGQICLCGSRVFVEGSAYKDFVDRFIEKAGQLKQGDPLEEKTEQGAIVSKTQLEKVKFYVDLAQKEGGKVALGGQAPDSINDRCRDGYFFPPTVLTDLPVSCRTNREEIFGPVVTITPFDSEDDVIGYANDCDYGLASSVWTQNLSRAHRVAEKIHTGTVWVNCWLVRDLRVPFGGMKQSGVGREGGEEALRFFTEPKNVCIAK